MSIKPEGFIETTFSFMGASTTETTTSFDASPTDYSASAVGGAFTGFVATIKENGVALGECTEIELNLENNLDGNVFVVDGTGQRYSMPEGLVKISGTIKALFSNMTLYNRAINNTETSIQITLTQGTGAGSANNEKIDIWLDEVLFEPNAPVISGPGGILVEMPFISYYQDNASASSLRIILWNTQTATVVTN